LLASTETLDGMTHERLARALLAQDGGAHAVLVDSSKTAWHSAAVRYLRLRYQDLARSPAETTRRLLAEILPGSEWRADSIGASGNRHQLYGNRMWSARLSLAEVKEDAGWTRDMPGVYRALLSALTSPLRRRYLNRWNARAVAALVAGVTLTRRSTMPAKSAAQQKAAGAALTAKRGKTSPSKLRGASKSMYKSMSERQAR
jgi:hypothetical protein